MSKNFSSCLNSKKSSETAPEGDGTARRRKFDGIVQQVTEHGLRGAARLHNIPTALLIVEDNLSFALELQMLLDSLNYQIIGRADHSAATLEMIYSLHPTLF